MRMVKIVWTYRFWRERKFLDYCRSIELEPACRRGLCRRVDLDVPWFKTDPLEIVPGVANGDIVKIIKFLEDFCSRETSREI